MYLDGRSFGRYGCQSLAGRDGEEGAPTGVANGVHEVAPNHLICLRQTRSPATLDLSLLCNGKQAVHEEKYSKCYALLSDHMELEAQYSSCCERSPRLLDRVLPSLEDTMEVHDRKMLDVYGAPGRPSKVTLVLKPSLSNGKVDPKQPRLLNPFQIEEGSESIEWLDATEKVNDYGPVMAGRKKANVNWRSVTIPASLPFTINRLKSIKEFTLDLENKYLRHPTMVTCMPPLSHTNRLQRPTKIAELFHFLILQRLSMGFQINLLVPRQVVHPQVPVYLSFGHVHHKVEVKNDEVHVEQYQRLDEKKEKRERTYKYLLQVPNSDRYSAADTLFCYEPPTTADWHRHDNYVTLLGDPDLDMLGLPHWRCTLVLLPLSDGVRKFQESLSPNAFDKKPENEQEKYEAALTSFLKVVSCVTSSHNRSPNKKTPELPSSATPAEIAAAMREELPVLTEMPSAQLSRGCFVSHDAIRWLQHHVADAGDISAATAVLGRLANANLIRHAWGQAITEVRHGFVIYQFSDQPPYKGQVTFSNDWPEVDYFQPDGRTVGANSTRQIYVNTDPGGVSTRPEWARLRHTTLASHQAAFMLTLEWLVSSGSLVGNLVFGWSMRAAQFGLALLPVPTYPFALPHETLGDPLRAPIYIPLGAGVSPEQLGSCDVSAFLHYVAARHGFVKEHHCGVGVCNVPGCSPHRLASVHISGVSFLAVVCDENDAIYPNPGFLWSWNFMLSRRWQTSHSGGVPFMDKFFATFSALLADGEALRRLHTEWLGEREAADVNTADS